MARPGLIGPRIRERRSAQGLRQAELAREVGISPSYLNLIEHNRRNIGGRVLIDIARVLRTDVKTLTDGAEAALVETLRAAAAGVEGATPELDRIEEFVGRFPGWAALLAGERRRGDRLERTVSALTDRLTHDPFLSASLHDVISTVTSIHSTSAILVDDPEIEPVWRTRFHNNLHEDSLRLAESAQGLVNYLDSAGDTEATLMSPQEELEGYLTDCGYHIAELEGDNAGQEAQKILLIEHFRNSATRTLATQYFARYAADARAMPLEAFLQDAEAMAFDPARLADKYAVDLIAAFRRLASLPPSKARPPIGLVSCDGSGTLTFRKPLEGFPVPRFGAACPLWPLYESLARPMTPLRAMVELSGRLPRRYLAYAISLPAQTTQFDAPPVLTAAMMILPADDIPMPGQTPRPIGTSCRICTRTACAARREPSILGDDS